MASNNTIHSYKIHVIDIFKIIKNVLLINKEDETIVSSLISEKLKTRTTPINAKKCIKYEKSGLTEKKAREIHDLLSQRMEKEHLFLNPELTLVELAKLMNIHPNNLSQVINTYEEKNFYNYINSKRIAMFKRMIVSNNLNKYTILSIAHDCGFNSKSSFNKHFKKSTNLTPKEFINSTIEI